MPALVRAATHDPISKLSDLDTHEFVSYIDDLLEMPELRYLEDIIRKPNVVFHSSSVIAQFNVIMKSVGLGMVHSFMAKGVPNLEIVLPDEIVINRSYWLLVHEDLRDVARVDAVCKFLTQILRNNENMMIGV